MGASVLTRGGRIGRPKYKPPRLLTLTVELPTEPVAAGADGDPELSMLLLLIDRLAQGTGLSRDVRMQRAAGRYGQGRVE
jgi:hypothetical protein